MKKTSYLTLFYAKKQSSITLGENIIPMHKMDLVFTRQNIPYSCDKDKVIVYLFKETLFDNLFFSQIGDCRIFYEFLEIEPLQEEHLLFATSKFEDIKHYMSLIQNQYNKKDEHHDKLLRLLLVGLITSLDIIRQDSLIVQKSTMISTNRFGKILKYMGDNYATCTLKETAKKFGYHPDYLSQRFKIITGVTFSEKLLSIRLEESLQLLEMSEMRVEDISASIGFKDKSWFMRKFKEAYHTTPAKYRKKIKKKDL